MWEARATNIQMDEGDYGVALPFTVKGVTLTALDCLRFLLQDVLTAALKAAKQDYHDSLQLLWDNINKGQRKQLYKVPEIKSILDRFGVEVDV